MAITVFKSLLPLLVISSLLVGCGLTQKVSDGTISTTKAIFYKQVKTLHLDFNARHASNNNPQGEPLATVVRVYQLRERKAFDTADYQQLSDVDSQVLKADLLDQRDLRVQPNGSAALDIPLDPQAKHVAVMALFLSPEIAQNSWRVVIDRADLDPDKPRVIELHSRQVQLKPLNKE
ncbi:type VI secretion system lipoprotein TssJ [Rahnella sp. SAP-1]|jgi:type VI secretion system protein VasD|uniref:Type VI secretion system lipoprotein TssJ n=1 Tax=Rouxiella aceris TaxID=2703884 RepID=A0A848MRF2_9GAMM|nr:type VI secretion system lipoprotein TssJ [Rouxiella aceris]NMP29873.1 type VI secretion system lipoprotein TssJ [Rouxiella aceris]